VFKKEKFDNVLFKKTFVKEKNPQKINQKKKEERKTFGGKG
jgi:hypothetical protein